MHILCCVQQGHRYLQSVGVRHVLYWYFIASQLFVVHIQQAIYHPQIVRLV
jgi:hypothetical protein